MQKKKEGEIAIRLSTILIVILLIIIVAVVIVKFGEDEQNVNLVEGNKVPIENELYSESGKETIATTDFSMKFLKLENNKQNMVYSPLSIKYALKMLSEGAKGNTKTQIKKVIGEQNLTKYNNIDKVMSLANGIYIRDTYSQYIKADYTRILAEKYNAEVKYDSFSNANNINNWIENKTLGIIKKMLEDDLVQNPDTEILLINALAIDMEWKNPFDANNTNGKEFNLENGNKMLATMMNKETKSDSASYYKDKDVTAVRMDLKKYENTQLEFVAIMPEGNLSNYIEKFTIEDFNNITKKLTLASETKYGIDISIPKFSLNYDLKLKNDLMKLGITDAFDGSVADFSNMSSRALRVDDTLHKADIEFSEEGVKAAAVTVIVMKDNAIMQPTQPIEININKPFLYVIRDKDTGEIWFVGTVYEPNSWEQDKADYQYKY